MILAAEDLARSLFNERLHLILMPTEACNFRCVYRYATELMCPARGIENAARSTAAEVVVP